MSAKETAPKAIPAHGDEGIVAKAEAVIAAKAVEAGAAIDTSLILSIINSIISLFKSCKQTSSTIAAKLKNPTPLTRLLVRNQVAKAMREQYGIGAWFKHGGAKVEQAVLEAGKEATADDVQALMNVDLGND